MALFHGLCAFPITPADPDGRVQLPVLERLLGRLLEAGVDSIGLLGSTGTYAYLDRAQRRRSIEAAATLVGGRVPLLAGIGALRTDDAIRLGEDARTAGADAVLLAPVSYTPLTADEVFEHFRAVAGAVRLPLCIYDNPSTTRFSFDDGLIARLSRIEHIVAAKRPATPESVCPERLRSLRAQCADGMALGYSVDWHAAEAIRAGGDGWYSVLAGLFPQPCRAIMTAIAEGRHEDAAAVHAGLQPLWDLFIRLGSLRVMFAAARLAGLAEADPPRPILPLDPPDRDAVAGILERLQLVPHG